MDLTSQLISAMDEYISKFGQSPILRMSGFKEFLKDKGITVNTSDILRAFKNRQSKVIDKYKNAKKNAENIVQKTTQETRKRLKAFKDNVTKTVDSNIKQAKNETKRLKSFAKEETQRRLKSFEKKGTSNKQTNTPKKTGRLKAFESSATQSKQASPDVPKTAATKNISKELDSFEKVFKGGNLTEKAPSNIKNLLSSGYANKVANATKAGLKGGAKTNVALGVISAGIDIANAYKQNGIDGVKNALPRLIAEYGAGAVGAALGGTLGGLTGNPLLASGGAILGGLGGVVAGDRLADKFFGANSPASTDITPDQAAENQRIIDNFDPASIDETLKAYDDSQRQLEQEQAATSQARNNYIAALQGNPVGSVTGNDTSLIANNPVPNQALKYDIPDSQVPVQNVPAQPTVNNNQATGGVDFVPNAQGQPTPTGEDIFASQMMQYLQQGQANDAAANQTMMQLLQSGYDRMRDIAANNPYYNGQVVQPQGYYVDPDALARAQAINNVQNRYNYYSGNTNVTPDEAQMLLNNASQMYQVQLANQAGVPYEDYIRGVTEQRVQQIKNEQFLVEQALTQRYKMATNDVERAKVMADIYKARQDYGKAIDTEIIKGEYGLKDTNLKNQGTLMNTNLQGQYDVKKANITGQYDLDKANIQGQYDLAQENMKQSNPYTNFSRLGSGFGYMWGTNPQGAASVINSLPQNVQNQLFPNMTQEDLRKIGRLQGQPTATQGGFGNAVQSIRNSLFNNGGLQANEQ